MAIRDSLTALFNAVNTADQVKLWAHYGGGSLVGGVVLFAVSLAGCGTAVKIAAPTAAGAIVGLVKEIVIDRWLRGEAIEWKDIVATAAGALMNSVLVVAQAAVRPR